MGSAVLRNEAAIGGEGSAHTVVYGREAVSGNRVIAQLEAGQIEHKVVTSSKPRLYQLVRCLMAFAWLQVSASPPTGGPVSGLFCHL